MNFTDSGISDITIKFVVVYGIVANIVFVIFPVSRVKFYESPNVRI